MADDEKKSISFSFKNITSKSWLRIIIAVILLAVLIWFYLEVNNPNIFPIKTVKVKGAYPHVQNQTLQNIITPYVKTSFFALNASALQTQLQQIPWIAKANVRRVFPSTLIVTLTEKQPILIWNAQQLMTADGTLFTPPQNTFPANLPVLNGPTGQEQSMLQTMQQINQVLQPLNLTVQELTLTPRQSWSMVVNTGTQIIIGQKDMWPRLNQMVAVYPKIVGDKGNKVIRIDLRYPNGMAVRWKR